MNDKMLAAVYYGPHDLRVEERPVPEISSTEALLKVISTGICGTDLRIWHGAHRKYPPGTIRIPGHEVVGDIIEVGSNVKGLELGQRVFMAPNMGCGHCRQCISGNNNLCAFYEAPGITFDGSFAQYMRIPAAAILQGNLIPISRELDPAAVALIEPFACVLRGQDAVHIQPGESVLVVGAGPIGIMHIMLAKLHGAGIVFVSELIPERTAQAMEFGADWVVNPTTQDLAGFIDHHTHSVGVDVVIVAAPAHKAQEIAIELAAIGGRINFFGGLPKDQPIIQMNSNMVHYKELLVTGTTASSTQNCQRAAEIVKSGRIDLSSLIEARFPLSEAEQAFSKADSGEALKVILEP
ncbi:MAG: alcohol dehydrogenase catalytic domain-containing protein [Anaerolineales bacterium]|nr:alcohol dehydrogenase catalytic domain-containing protein [Anaerolineales bacterium]